MKKVFALAALLLLWIFGGMAETPSRSVLRIATDATFPPFHFVDEAGEVTGFDIELARAVARRAGFEPEIRVLPYEKLFSELLAGEHHMVAATTGVTPERQERYLFSEPY